MKTRLESQAAVDGVAGITKRTSELSHTLFDIASGLVVDTDADSSISQTVCKIAGEFADIAQLCREACTLLEQEKGDKKKKIDAGTILSRLDVLVREFEDTLIKFTPKRVPKWLKRIFQNECDSIMTKCHSIKEPLRLHLSILRIAEVQRSSNKTSNKKKKKKEEIALTMAIECECAESWVETNRQVIKVLMNAERRLQKGFPRDLFELNNWTESPGATAEWIYDLVFNKVISTQLGEPGPSVRGGRVKTVRTTDGDATASESEEDDDIGSISPDLERVLDKSSVRSQVVNELLERWTGVRFKDVRQISETNDKGQSRLQENARRVVRWYRKNEKSTDDSTPPPTRKRVKKSRSTEDLESSTETSNDAQDDKPPVPSPPNVTEGNRRRNHRNKLAEDDSGSDWDNLIGPTTKKGQEGKDVVGEEQVSASDESKRFVLVDAQKPLGAALKRRDAAGSASRFSTNTVQSPGANSSVLGQDGDNETNPWLEPNLDLGKESKDPTFSVEEISELDLDANVSKGKEPAPVVSGKPSPEVALPKTSDTSTSKPIMLRPGMDEYQTVGGQQYRIMYTDESEQQTQKKSTLSKSSMGEGSSRRSQDQNTKRRSNHSATSKVEFLDPEPERSSDRRSRDHVPARESSRGRHSEEASSRNTRHSTQNTRHRSSTIPELPKPPMGTVVNTYGTGSALPTSVIPPLPYPIASGLVGSYISPYAHPYPIFYDQSGPSNERQKSDVAELRGMLIENEKARRIAEDAREEDRISKALALKAKEEELMKTIDELRENARRSAEKWEVEKRAIERKIALQAQVDKEARPPIQQLDDLTSHYKKEVDRLYGILERFNKEKQEEMMEQREQMEEYANAEIARKIEEYEEEHETAIEEALAERVQHYEGLIRVEQKKVEEANVRAEVYVKKYNDEFARRSTPNEPPKPSPTTPKATKEHLNVFDFMQRPGDNWSLGSSHEADTGTTTEDDSTESELLQNQWRGERGPYMHSVPHPRVRPFTAASEAATSSLEDASNVIIFPPRAGWNEMGHNQLGNYLSMSGFKPYFEVREPSMQDPTGRREKIGTGGNVLRGTLFWQPPASTAEADLYKSLRSSGWRPTYVRTTISGQTWFFGAQPVHAQFFSDMYKPQVGAYRASSVRPDTEKESLIISRDLVEIEELEFLGHIYKESDGKIFLDPTLTSEDIDHIVARSFLAREGRYRKRFRNTQLRASQTKVDITELASEVGESVSEISFGGRERTVSLWSLWSPWSR